jgi:hypothetical protein
MDDLDAVANWVEQEWGSATSFVADEVSGIGTLFSGVQNFVEIVLVLILLIVLAVVAVEFFAPRLLGV